ncbi:hypothetical protein LWI29_000422 [Acer saccharum]|uniref:Uncharacterized protein n=1 Tax=Acer saccharum TaxID=4024 RepID=A0AA39RU01_ACESA|nr:hypothetical protein LWI29_000422 [Acer saccharum]
MNTTLSNIFLTITNFGMDVYGKISQPLVSSLFSSNDLLEWCRLSLLEVQLYLSYMAERIVYAKLFLSCFQIQDLLPNTRLPEQEQKKSWFLSLLKWCRLSLLEVQLYLSYGRKDCKG